MIDQLFHPTTDQDHEAAALERPALEPAQAAQLRYQIAAWAPIRDRAQDEPAHQYQVYALKYALEIGHLETFTLSQLEAADSAAAWIVATLEREPEQPTQITQDAQRLNSRLHELRLQMAARMATKRRQLAQLQRLIDQALEQPPDPAAAPDAAQDGQEPQSDADRATMLLRAALMLIMGPQAGQDGNGGGGRPARLQPPPPTRPSPGQAAQPPHAPAPRRF